MIASVLRALACAATVTLVTSVCVADTPAYRDLVVFDKQLGAYPGETLVASNGLLYGVLQLGGPHAAGAIYRLLPDGSQQILHEFGETGRDANIPNSPVIEATDGNLYGLARQGGNRTIGVIYRMSLDGAGYEIVHSFGGGIYGESPQGGPIQARDGDLYGVTLQGGPKGLGTVWRFSLTGRFKIIHRMRFQDGGYPVAGLVEGRDGLLYGTASQGGRQVGQFGGGGTVFSVSPEGAFRTLHRFADADGITPTAALIQGPDGSLYGTTSGGGQYGYGTVFRLEPSGRFSVLYAFGGQDRDGLAPGSRLLIADDGSLLGTTPFGGGLSSACLRGCGTVFQLARDGRMNVLHAFDDADSAARPSSGLTRTGPGRYVGAGSGLPSDQSSLGGALYELGTP